MGLTVRHIPAEPTGKASDLRGYIIGGGYTVDLLTQMGTFEIVLFPAGAKYYPHDLIEIREDNGLALRGKIEEITQTSDQTTLKGSLQTLGG